MNAQAGYQATGEDGRRAASAQQVDRAFERRPKAQRIGNLHHRRLTHRGENLAADHGPDHRRQQQGGDHGDRVYGATGDRDAGDHQQEVAGRERNRDPTLLDEDQARDDGNQEIAAQVRDRADRVQLINCRINGMGRYPQPRKASWKRFRE